MSKTMGETLQRKLSLSKAVVGLQEPEPKSRYAPPEHFKVVEGAEPLLDDVLDSNTELWLVRIPTSAISQDDLTENSVRIDIDAADGNVGHFYNSQGQEFRIVRQDSGDILEPYAITPTASGEFRVRKIRHHVGLVRSLISRKESGAPGTPSSSSLPVKEDAITVTDMKPTTNTQQSAEKPVKKKRRHDAP